MACTANRRRISRALDDGRPLDGDLRDHLAQCADCAGFQEESLALDAALRTNASPARDEVSGELHEAIMRAVHSDAAPRPHRLSIRLPTPLLVGLAACLLIVCGFSVTTVVRTGRARAILAANTIADCESQLAAIAARVSLLVDAPMQMEVAALRSDMHRTTEYLLAYFE